jgi:hypothetical protein
VSVKVGNVVLWISEDGKTGWRPLKAEEAPGWLKEPGTLGAMLEGLLAHKESEPDSPWYAAVTGPMPGQQSNVIDLRKPRLVLPKDAQTLLPSGEALSEDVALDTVLQETGITRAQMLGDGGNAVPDHPAFDSPEAA